MTDYSDDEMRLRIQMIVQDCCIDDVKRSIQELDKIVMDKKHAVRAAYEELIEAEKEKKAMEIAFHKKKCEVK